MKTLEELGVSGGEWTYDSEIKEIDGQQRLWAIQCYLEDQFPVFGYRWSEVTRVDQRFFETGAHFHCYITESEDEEYLKSYYNMMNFGGTAHRESERA